jgi:hypothetical protein
MRRVRKYVNGSILLVVLAALVLGIVLYFFHST